MQIARDRRTLLLCIVLAVVWTPGIAADAGVPSGTPEPSRSVPKPKRPRFAVRSLRAYLYYHARGPLEDVRGRFDDADILTGKVALWNVLGGGGDAQAPSSAVLVLVDIEGPGFGSGVPAAASLNVTAESGDRKLRGARLRLREFFSKSQLITLPVIIYGSVCGPLQITARLEGVEKQSVMAGTAPFNCGE